MKKERVLVTGGTGYIGSHTAIELIQQGYEPIIIDNLSNSKLERLDQIETITGVKPQFEQIEMCDKEAMNSFFEKYQDIQAVIHFAALLQVGESVENPLLYYSNNLVSTINLLECMRKFSIPNIVFSSSCTVYGNPKSLPVDEDAPIQPAVSPYGNTKKMCEDIIRDFVNSVHNCKAISLRYFNPIGNHPSALIGEEPHGVPTHLVPYITQTARKIRKELNIFGKDYQTKDGTCVRDYLHVVDLAKAHIAAIRRLIDIPNTSKWDYFNIGTGTGYSVLEMVHAFEKATGIEVPYVFATRREGDVEAVYADTSKAEKLLNWKTELDLEAMLKSAWDWEQKLLH